MSYVCSRCSNIHDAAKACPRCGAPVPQLTGEDDLPKLGPRWQQTSVGRIIIGLILAQGLFYGLRHLATGILMAMGHIGDGGSLRDAPDYQTLLLAIQGLGLTVGGMLAGGAHRSGWLLGIFVGGWNAALAHLLTQNGQPIFILAGHDAVALCHVACGFCGGAMGMLIWRPIPITTPTLLAPTAKKPTPRPKTALLAGKISWIRVLLGTAIVVAGTLWASALLTKAVKLSSGRIGPEGAFQAQLITWELKAMAVLLGAAFAGAGTQNGLKQGLIVGLLGSMLLIGLQSQSTDKVIEVAGLTLIGTFSLSIAGGWFGGQLFPPVVQIRRRIGATW